MKFRGALFLILICPALGLAEDRRVAGRPVAALLALLLALLQLACLFRPFSLSPFQSFSTAGAAWLAAILGGVRDRRRIKLDRRLYAVMRAVPFPLSR